MIEFQSMVFVLQNLAKGNGNWKDSPVNYVVYDSLLPWALDVARQFVIYEAVFLTN